jgi:2-methylisocitrate lyase-like PEP mutase family enzyme
VTEVPVIRALSSAGTTPGKTLRALLDAGENVLLPGVPDALTARIAERVGFQACYLSGAGYANSQLALPDVGLTSRQELTDHARRIVAACSLPVVVDGDTGFGGPIAVMRTVRDYEAAGASAIQLEDQRMPKRCGHFDGKQIITCDEMVTNIRAAKLAASEHFVLIARTDALAVEGLDAAIERGRAFAEAGADAVFIEAPESLADTEEIARRLTGVPLVINVVEGGKTPQLSASEYFTMGYRIALYANFVMRTMMHSAIEALSHLVATGETVSRSASMLTWEQRQELVGLSEVEQLENFIGSQEPRQTDRTESSP